MTAMDNAHALVVGIANYQWIKKLPVQVLNDAQDVHDLLIDRNRCGYPMGNVQLLLDKQATKPAICQALQALAARSDEDSTVMVYFSGHGGRIESDPCAGEYLLPVEVDGAYPQSLAKTSISGSECTVALQAIPARKVVVIFDCCHAGGIGQLKGAMAPTVKAGLPESYYEKLAAGRGRVILASSRDNEYSYVMSPDARNSLFTYHLLAGLRGGAPNKAGLIYVIELFKYLHPLVTCDQPNQHPFLKAGVEEDLAIALYPGGEKDPMSLDTRIVLVLDDHWAKHPGQPRMRLNDLIVAAGFGREDVVDGLYELQEKDWVDFNLLEAGESGLVWLTSLGRRVAADIRSS